MTTMCDIITLDGTPQLSALLIIQLYFSVVPLMMSLMTFHNPGTFFFFFFFLTFLLPCTCLYYGWSQAWQFAHDGSFFQWQCSKKKKSDRSVPFEAFLNVSRKVFALPPFACECPVWLYPVKCSQEKQLQMLSNPSFPVHHRAGTLFERCSAHTMGHLDSACLVTWNWWSFSWGAGGRDVFREHMKAVVQCCHN